MRGALLHALLRQVLVRIIPARAGSTQCIPQQRCGRRDHPRSCGEHYADVKGTDGFQGSSPLVRGALDGPHGRGPRGGIIPARAVSTALSQPRAGLPWDHPRSCGEHPEIDDITVRVAGSSPLVRGALPAFHGRSPHHGIIPARAGSTPSRTRWGARSRDHPRSCGEHSELLELGSAYTGSSPLVRGALICGRSLCLRGRIIPARAGSTAPERRRRRRRRDHPRSCGEHQRLPPAVSDGVGSSPLVRGAPARGKHPLRPAGIIPARAGSTPMASTRHSTNGDHPRSCGEHHHSSSSSGVAKGSSPLVRGAQIPLAVNLLPAGIIPARAGSTWECPCQHSSW